MFKRRKKKKEVSIYTAYRILIEFFAVFWVIIFFLWENSFRFYLRVFLINVLFIGMFLLIHFWKREKFFIKNNSIRKILMKLSNEEF